MIYYLHVAHYNFSNTLHFSHYLCHIKGIEISK